MAKTKKKTPVEYDEDDFEDEDEDEGDVEEEEEEEEEKPKKPVVPDRRPTAKEKRHPRDKRPETNDKYQAYSIPARAGIMEKESQEPILEDDLTFKAWVMNKLQKIEDAVC